MSHVLISGEKKIRAEPEPQAKLLKEKENVAKALTELLINLVEESGSIRWTLPIAVIIGKPYFKFFYVQTGKTRNGSFCNFVSLLTEKCPFVLQKHCALCNLMGLLSVILCCPAHLGRSEIIPLLQEPHPSRSIRTGKTDKQEFFANYLEVAHKLDLCGAFRVVRLAPSACARETSAVFHVWISAGRTSVLEHLQYLFEPQSISLSRELLTYHVSGMN